MLKRVFPLPTGKCKAVRGGPTPPRIGRRVVGGRMLGIAVRDADLL